MRLPLTYSPSSGAVYDFSGSDIDSRSASQQARLNTILKSQTGSWIEQGGDGEVFEAEFDEEAKSLGVDA